MRPKLIVCVGVPGCGKSTWAALQKEQNPEIVVVTRDDIREEYDATGGGWSREKEYFVVEEMKRRIVQGLMEGRDVISADTNISPRIHAMLKQIAERCDAVYSLQIFNTTLLECIERDSKREGHKKVGEQKIREYYENFIRFLNESGIINAYTEIANRRN